MSQNKNQIIYWNTDAAREFDYRYSERLGLLIEDREPTPEQVKLATAEARIGTLRANLED
jgi:hypothetical protein